MAIPMRRTIGLFAGLLIALTACNGFASDRTRPSTVRTVDWDGRRRIPAGPAPSASIGHRADPAKEIREQQSKLAGIKPYTAEWWQAQEELDRMVDNRLARAMAICKGCGKPTAGAVAAAPR